MIDYADAKVLILVFICVAIVIKTSTIRDRSLPIFTDSHSNRFILAYFSGIEEKQHMVMVTFISAIL
jgi:hypothetical protein